MVRWRTTGREKNRDSKSSIFNTSFALFITVRHAAKPFVYKAPGERAAIGRRKGVARIVGLKLSGIIGWTLWRSVYLI
jgi:NADH dehydrogenase FAD-containing subunit